MPVIDKRIEKSSISVIELRNLLRNVCQSPDSYINDSELRGSLKSQGALAKHSCSDLLIVPTSINTLKRISDEYVEGGFETLDALRKNAMERIESAEQKFKSSNKRTRAGLAQRASELEQKIDILEKVNFVLIQSLSHVIKDINSVAGIDDIKVREIRAKEAVKRLVSITATNPPPFDQIQLESDVISIKRK